MAKKLKFLIVPLTSGEFVRLKRCLYSLEHLTPTDDTEYDIEYDILIVANSKDMNYIGQLKNELGDKYNIVVTPSDGTPGTGKNSVFNVFRQQTKHYDYLLQVDGDDFLYPSALRQISALIEKSDEADVISFQSMDWMSTNFTDKMNYAPIIDKKLWLYSWCDTEPNLREIPAFVYVNDPKFGKEGRIFTPGTSMLLSRKFLKKHPSCKHTNKISLFEDYLYYLKLFKLHLDKKIKMVHINNSFIYVYDKANIESISTKNCYYSNKEIDILTGFVKENNMAEFHPKDHMPFIEIGPAYEFSLTDKIVWCRHLIERYPVELKSLVMDTPPQAQTPLINKRLGMV